jgi:RNA polymerase sigma-70 factor (ECF subfamily)
LSEHKTSESAVASKADHEHMAAVEAGSQTSWGKLYERHHSGLVRFCGNFTTDPQLSEDWAQEALLRLKENAHTFQKGAEVKPWLYKIARNICHEHSRKNREMQWSDSVFATRAISLTDSGPSPASKIVGLELTAELKTLLMKINEDQRLVFILKYVEDLSRKEIAEVLNMPEATVKIRLGRTLKYMRERLNPIYSENTRLG